MNTEKIAVLGGDMRQSYLIEALESCGYTVSAYGIKGYATQCEDTLIGAISGADAAVLPYPLSPDGVYLNAICENCNIKLRDLFRAFKSAGVSLVFGGSFKNDISELAGELNIKTVDYGKSEAVLIKNALCTAEGALEIAMRELPINLHGSKSAVLGYGRIGKLLCARLKALGSNVYTVARKPEALSYAEAEGIYAVKMPHIQSAIENADVIFNTAPSMILDLTHLLTLRKDCLIIDLASSPGGVDFNEAERLGLKVIWALSLPGKCSPKSAALIISEAVHEYISQNLHSE